MAGLPLSLHRDSTNSLLDPVRGTRAALTFAPYTGVYGKPFNASVVRFDGSAYYDVLGNERLVLAGRLSAATLTSDSSALPAILMLYSGGGGSVRGYAYQSLGPRDTDNDPLGGRSLLETGLELRFKISEQFGIVPFLDGGNVYNGNTDFLEKLDPRWGAGLGLRYYTPIGPVRLDMAVPLNKRKDDSAWSVYISIGQSF
jgi:translocation and assembly module TamA